jgi:hypothetical protein
MTGCRARWGLLRRCLQQQPEKRLADMAEVAAALQPIYQHVTGDAYPRQAPGQPKPWRRV